MRGTALAAATLAGALALSATANAATPYLKPTDFAPSRNYVPIQAAMTEGDYFIPNFPIRSDGDYLITGPDGKTAKIEAVTALKAFAVLEPALPTDGTYRISTGVRAGRTLKWAKIDGAWRIVRPAGAPQAAPRPAAAPQGETDPNRPRFIEEAAVPSGAETTTSSSYMRADTYVTRGAPTPGALKATGQGLEIEPITHPNEAYAGEAIKFRLLNDGKPVGDFRFVISRGDDTYADQKFSYVGKTGANGEASVRLDRPGAYVLEVDYPARAEGGPPQPIARSDVYTLTFEVTR